VPRLFPLTSPRLPFDDGQTGPVTGESVDTTNAAPAKGVFLTRHLYGSAGAAKRAAAKRAATAAATASTITESGQAVPGADATGAITTMATCGTGTCNYTAGNITSCFLPPTGRWSLAVGAEGAGVSCVRVCWCGGCSYRPTGDSVE